MPYKIFQSGSKWEVWEVDEDDESKRVKKVGTHPSRTRAKKQKTALDINVTAKKETDAEEISAEESYSGYEAMPMDDVPWGAMSFEDIDAADEVQELMERLEKRTSQFYTLFWRIWNNIEIPVSEKVTAWSGLFNEFTQVFQGEIAMEDAEMGELEEFSESATGSIIRVSESGKQNGEARQPLKMDIAIIEPGFGNPKDKHYYPADVLRRDAAKVFEGAKMYATDHRPEEKSVRTEVGKIERVIRFSETGAPVARVKIWDADFAEDIRNRNELEELGTLEVSILAKGKAKKGTVDGQECNIVEAIIPSKYTNVDFVTSAGAGGRALQLVENEEADMPEEIENAAAELEPAEVQENEDVILHENENEETVTEEQPEEIETAEAIQEEPTYLAESDIESLLEKSNLPQVSIGRLVKVRYLSEAELHSAIAEEKAYIKTLIHSGEVTGLGESRPVKEVLSAEELVEDHQKRIDAVIFG